MLHHLRKTLSFVRFDGRVAWLRANFITFGGNRHDAIVELLERFKKVVWHFIDLSTAGITTMHSLNDLLGIQIHAVMITIRSNDQS